jgi:hypothetical protein
MMDECRPQGAGVVVAVKHRCQSPEMGGTIQLQSAGHTRPACSSWARWVRNRQLALVVGEGGSSRVGEELAVVRVVDRNLQVTVRQSHGPSV